MKPFSTSKNRTTKAITPTGTEPAAAQIRAALASVSQLREQRQADPALAAAVNWVKQFQLSRFQASYADLLASPIYASTAQFFVTHLYGDASPEQRDAQFARIAPSIAKVFPAQVVQTAVEVSQLHALTEQLDHDMACASLALHAKPLGQQDHGDLACTLYLQAWRRLDCAPLRHQQLSQVLALGQIMGELVQVKGLTLALRMMRGPAHLAHMGALQNWLEEGFATFAALHRHPGATPTFLDLVNQRETTFIDALTDSQEPTQQDAGLVTLRTLRQTTPSAC